MCTAHPVVVIELVVQHQIFLLDTPVVVTTTDGVFTNVMLNVILTDPEATTPVPQSNCRAIVPVVVQIKPDDRTVPLTFTLPLTSNER